MELNMCRLCLKNDNFAINVFKETEKKLSHKIFECFGVQIKQDDPITQKICKRCFNYTNSVYTYRIASQQNDNKLKMEYEETNKPRALNEKNNFLNCLKLKSNPNFEIHETIKNLKRKYPTINIPDYCKDMNIEPIVKLIKLSSSNTTKSTSSSPDAPHILRECSVKLLKTINDSNDIKYNCSVCSRDFLQEKYLLKHKCKKDLPPYACANCPKRYVLYFNYKNHLASKACKKKTAKKVLEDCANVSKISAQIKETKTDLKVMLDINEKISDSLFKLSKEATPEISINNVVVKSPETPKINEEIEEVESPKNEAIQEEDNSLKTNLINSSDLLVHGEEVNAFLCLTCNKIFDTLDSLKYHKRSSHKLSLRCDQCTKKFTVVEALLRHKKEIHRNIAQPISENSNEIEENIEEIPTNLITTTNIDEISENLTTNIDEIPEKIITTTNIDEINERKTVSSPGKQPTLSVTLEPLPASFSPRGRMVAKKRTNGALFNPNPTYKISSDSDSSLSSSSSSDDEDDCKITCVNKNTNNVEFKSDNFFLDTALTPQKFPLLDDEKNENENEKKSRNIEEVMIIDSDSDNDNEEKNDTAKTTEIFSSSDEATTQKKNPELSPSRKKISDDLCSPPILISANSDENPNEHDAAGPVNNSTTIKNELNFINYLFNKCNVDEKTNTQFWNLEDLSKLAKKIVVPIEINKSNDQNVSIHYGDTSTQKPKAVVPSAPWSLKRAIDLHFGANSKSNKQKQITITTKNSKVSIKVPILPAVKPKIVSGPRNLQYTAKYVPDDQNATKKLQNIQPKTPVHYMIAGFPPMTSTNVNSKVNHKTPTTPSLNQQNQSFSQQNVNQQSLSQQNVNQQNLRQQNLNQQSLSQQNLNQQNFNQQNLNQQVINQQNFSHQNLNQQSLSHQNLNQQNLSQQNLNQQNLNQQSLSQQKFIQQNILHQQSLNQQNLNQQSLNHHQNVMHQNQEITQNIPNKTINNDSSRSILRNTLSATATSTSSSTTTTPPQPIVYTYLPTIPPNQQQTDQPFVINGIPYQPVNNMTTKNTIVFQQLDQSNYLNISHQPTYFTTNNSTNASLMHLNENQVQDAAKNEQMNEVSSSSLLQNVPLKSENETETTTTHRPTIRIKSLAELQSNSQTVKNNSFINVYANYVSNL